MTLEYPYSSARVLTDQLYVQFGGHTGSSSQAQRNGAYLIAEKQMTSHLSSFLVSTKITGTFPWPYPYTHIALPYAYVRSIDNVRVFSQECYCNCDLDTFTGCAFVWSDTYGYIDVRQTESACGCACCGGTNAPYQVEVVWTSGLTSGSVYQADMLLALTMAAEINLNEMIDPYANEGVGDIGIQTFVNQQYREERVKLGRTSFGTSARAQKIKQLVANYRHRRALRF